MMRKKSSHKSECGKVFTRWKPSIAVAVILGYGLTVPGPAPAAPQGGVVTSGAAAISQSGAVTNINQSTNKASINWQSFSTRPTETVNFNQPNVSSLTLNRVIGNEKSVLEGVLNANGKVFLINSNGVLMTKGSTVNAAGFVASTLNISDDDFNAGNYVFKADGPTGSVINLGTITVKNGGYVALLGNSVSNRGVITATRGTVSLNSGDKVTLNFNGDSLISVTVDEGTLNALVDNKEAIYADGGTVILTAKAADDLLSAQVNNSGLIQARTIDDLKGNINIHAYGGTAGVNGTLDASAPTSGDGGTIETSGDKVKIADSAVITTKSVYGKTGNWLIDPDGFTIGSGGDITGTLLGTLLGYNNITLSSTDGSGSDGDIKVNQAVNWSADTILTLNATNDININKTITATGANAGLALNYGGDYHILTKASYSGAVLDANGNPVANPAPAGTEYASITLSGTNAGLKINGTTYTLIHSMSQLAALDDATGTATGNFALAEDLYASGTTYGGAPIARFNGTLAGLGHTISNLTISGSANYVGLIGQTVSGATTVIRDIGLENVNISTTGSIVGALLGKSSGGLTISQAYSTGAISGKSIVGGLVGQISSTGSTVSNIMNSYSGVNTIATLGYAAGLVASATYTNVSNSHAAGSVTASNGAGLIYYATAANIANCYATGDVSGTGTTGGLVGQYASGSAEYSIRNSFATGNVTGGALVGGLIGWLSALQNVTIDNCHATGNVTSDAQSKADVNGVGGLIGARVGAGTVTISNSYASGNVTLKGSNVVNVGGLIGSVGGQTAAGVTNITKSYATGDVTASGGTYVGGLIGYATDGTNISRCYATGDVVGASERSPGGAAVAETGGLVGLLSKGSITDSYASGTVTGYDAGGLVGGIAFSPVTNSYWNADRTNSAFGTSAGVTSTNNQGLTSAQLKDIPYYLNGTIKQVLAGRAAAAAYMAAAGSQASSTSGQAQQDQVDQTKLYAGFEEKQLPSINDHIVYADSADYSADIKAIDADGFQFELEEKAHRKKM